MIKSILKVLFLFVLLTLFFSCTETSKNTAKTTNSNKESTETIEQKKSSHDVNIDRLFWQKPDKVLELIDNLKYSVVADIGAGAGYFSFKMLPFAKKVIAIDIDSKAIAFLNDTKENLLSEELKEKFEVRKALENDPLLHDGEVDAILMVNTFMYINDRVDYLKKMKKGLKKNGEVLIVDFKKKRLPKGPPSKDKITLNEVENDLIEAGFNVVLSDDKTLDYQYIVKAINNK